MIEIGGLMGMYEKKKKKTKKNKEGGVEAKPHGRWKGEGMIGWNWWFNGYEKKKIEREMRGQNPMELKMKGRMRERVRD